MVKAIGVQVVCSPPLSLFFLNLLFQSFFRSYGLEVMTPPCHGGNTSSIPVGSAIFLGGVAEWLKAGLC